MGFHKARKHLARDSAFQKGDHYTVRTRKDKRTERGITQCTDENGKPVLMTQAEIRRSVSVGPLMGQVSSVKYWFHHHHFRNDDEARGAFELAHQQGLMGWIHR